jgi:hypothetical protein
MTRKQKILQLIEKLPDDVTYGRVIYHIGVMRAIEIGLEQAERGEVIDHDELFAQLQAEDEEAQNRLVGSGKRGSEKNSTIHRKGRAANSAGIHKPAKKTRRNA